MSMTWNLKEARDLVESLYDKEQLELANPSLNSVIERRDHANIHWHNIRNLLNGFARQAKTRPLFAIALGVDSKARDRYYLNIAKAQAYVIALVQSLHSIPDIYAHAIYYALALDKSDPLKEERFINAYTVADKLKAPDLAVLRTLYRDMFEGGEFKHLAAISNHSKHRSVVQPSLNEDYTGTKEKVRLEYPAFTFDGKDYPAVPVREFTEREYDRCAALIVTIGNALNEVLRGRQLARGVLAPSA
jgi:hypothetical protein